MKVIYEGPFAEVEVPHDDVAGAAIIAVRGKIVDVPDEVGESLLSQGEDSGENPVHARVWRKATAKEAGTHDKQTVDADPTTHEGADQ